MISPFLLLCFVLHYIGVGAMSNEKILVLIVSLISFAVTFAIVYDPLGTKCEKARHKVEYAEMCAKTEGCEFVYSSEYRNLVEAKILLESGKCRED